MPEGLVTAEELRAILAVSKPTFYRSYAALMCLPVSKTSYGRGVRVYYAASARQRAQWVKECRERGMSLAQIAEQIQRGNAPGCHADQ